MVIYVIPDDILISYLHKIEVGTCFNEKKRTKK